VRRWNNLVIIIEFSSICLVVFVVQLLMSSIVLCYNINKLTYLLLIMMTVKEQQAVCYRENTVGINNVWRWCLLNADKTINNVNYIRD